MSLDAFSLEVVDSLEKQDGGLCIIGLAVCNFRTKQAEYLKDKAIFGQEREVTWAIINVKDGEIDNWPLASMVANLNAGACCL